LERVAKRKWIAITLAAVILPMSLLTTFKLTGIIPEPQTPETITLKPIYWEMERPSYSTNVGEEIKNTYTDGGVTVEMGVFVAGYSKEHSFYDYDDLLEFSVFVNATQGAILSSMIKYYPVDENATILLFTDEHTLILRNATATEMNKFGTNSSEAYVAIKALNKPCYIKSWALWVFQDKNFNYHQLRTAPVETHQVHADLEVLCFNGSVYKKIVTPIHLEVWAPEAGNDFETAKSINPGRHLAYLDAYGDIEDYYVTLIEEGRVVNLKITYPGPYHLSDFDLYLYDDNKELRANSCSPGIGVTEHVTFIADYTGLWYIRIHGASGLGLYTLEITTVQQ
jgi:hypothetical protein